MVTIETEGLIPAPVAAVYAVVADVERYPEFLPEIARAELEGDEVSMSMKLGSMTISWQQRASFELNKAIHVRLVRGPFRVFDVNWQFEPVEGGTWVKHQTRFETKLRLPGVDRVVAKRLRSHVDRTIDAFRQRVAGVIASGEEHREAGRT